MRSPMPEPSLTLVPNTCPTAEEVAERLSRALVGRIVPACRVHAEGRQASPAEGLALVESLLAIRQPGVRQALLDAASALASGD